MPKHVEEDGREYWTRVVYVVELNQAACAQRSSPCRGRRCGRIPLYVGETALTPEERFAQHQAGIHVSKAVESHGRRIRPDLAAGFGEMKTVEESRRAEKELWRRLSLDERGMRYCVHGGH